MIGMISDHAMPVDEAAAEVGITAAQVYGRANGDPRFADQLDAATWALCAYGTDDPAYGTSAAYKGRARGQKPSCRGTACREWRRTASRQERASPASVTGIRTSVDSRAGNGRYR